MNAACIKVCVSLLSFQLCAVCLWRLTPAQGSLQSGPLTPALVCACPTNWASARPTATSSTARQSVRSTAGWWKTVRKSAEQNYDRMQIKQDIYLIEIPQLQIPLQRDSFQNLPPCVVFFKNVNTKPNFQTTLEKNKTSNRNGKTTSLHQNSLTSVFRLYTKPVKITLLRLHYALHQKKKKNINVKNM